MDLLDRQQPPTPLRSSQTCRYSYSECQRVRMTARAEEMSDATTRGRKRRNRDDRWMHGHTPLERFSTIKSIDLVDLLAQECGYIPLIIRHRRSSLHRVSSISHTPQKRWPVEIFERSFRI